MRISKIYTRVEQPAPVTCYLPYTRVSPQLQFVVDHLRIQQIEPELVKVDSGDAYWRLLRDAWALGQTFFIVEQDVAVWYGSIQQMFECEEGWCTLPTMCHGRMIKTTFGCVKFDRDFIAKRSGWWDDIDTTWYHLDANFADKTGWPFIKPHAHWPAATHLNEVQWSDEVSMRFTLDRKLVWRAREEGQGVASVQYRLPGEKRSEHYAHAIVDDKQD